MVSLRLLRPMGSPPADRYGITVVIDYRSCRQSTYIHVYLFGG